MKQLWTSPRRRLIPQVVLAAMVDPVAMAAMVGPAILADLATMVDRPIPLADLAVVPLVDQATTVLAMEARGTVLLKYRSKSRWRRCWTCTTSIAACTVCLL